MTKHWDEESAVRSVTFERATHTLRVQLVSGATFDFADVPEHLYDELVRSPWRDDFFREHVRDEFSAKRVGEVDLADMVREQREDRVLGAPLAEDIASGVAADVAGPRREREVPLGPGSDYGTEHTWIVGVIEDDSAAVEVDGRQIMPLPRWLLPADAHDGDILRVTHARSAGRSTLSIELDRSGARPTSPS
jgi:hypothetical protein